MKKLVLLLTIWIFVLHSHAQNVGINTTTPLAKLHVNLGNTLSSGVLFSGTDPIGGGTFPSLGEGYRFMYYPGRGVIRAGYVDGTQWDNSQVGNFSFAFGYNTIAKGGGSCAIGDGTYAGGTISTAFGNSTITKGYSSFVLGMFNDPVITGADQDFALPNTPLFMVGNGEGNFDRNNALSIYKNGDLLLKNPAPVLTDPGLKAPPVIGPGTRMMWLAEKSAFRLGTVDNNNWNADSIGTWSTGIGYSTKAKGQFSLAMGLQTTASGGASTALGFNTVASGENAVAMGSGTTASNLAATSIGFLTLASGKYATAFGHSSRALGINSTAIGFNTTAQGVNSIAMGSDVSASGDIATSMGFNTDARSYGSVALGRWNDSILISNKTAWINSDPLFTIGNGTSEAARHNAMVVYKNGNMVLKNPNAYYYNKLPANYPVPVNGEGTRMMWLPEISAFRVGTVSDTAWNAGNIGEGSIALGLDCMAKGEGSLAFGTSTIASGSYSTVLGSGTRARGFTSTVLGICNDPILTTPESEISVTTPLFIIGNGDNLSDRRNAMVVRKDGHVGIGTNVPGTFLHVDVGSHYGDGVIVQGTIHASATVPNLGSGSRMTFYPGKAAFRAGFVSSTHWDNSFTGFYSVAMGYDASARGTCSTAFGIGTVAEGDYSLATGGTCFALGNYSTAMGKSTRTTGLNSIAMGELTNASGLNALSMGYFNAARSPQSVALGYRNIAKGFSSMVIGIYNDSLFTSNETVINPSTPLFVVGNGDGPAAGQRHNAMVVRKDGSVGVGTNTPVARLTAVGPAGLPSIPGTSTTGIFRVGLNDGEGIDMGKMDVSPFSGWIQAGINGTLADPLSLQPAGGKVGIGTSNPASSAVLDVSSTSKGFLPPRMTYANRVGISSPVAGLMIWCSNCGAYGQLQIYNGSFWTNLGGSPAVATPVIGMHDGGGIIAYIFQVGDPGYVAGETHGLIITQNDVGSSNQWGCNGSNLPGAAGTALGTGAQNTIDITNGCGSSGIAARLCLDLLEGGYADWYLPSKDELNKLYLNQGAIGGLTTDSYWSSSESSATQAWTQDFLGGTQIVQTKSLSFRVRAVRSF